MLKFHLLNESIEQLCVMLFAFKQWYFQVANYVLFVAVCIATGGNHLIFVNRPWIGY